MLSVLTIAGSDSSGGAGIEADIKTITAHGLYAECAITALTAQNTTGVYGVCEIDPGFVAEQIDVVFDDIRPDAVKIGMVSSYGIVEAIAHSLERNHARNVVLDPVMVATSGSALINDEAMEVLIEALFPLASVITPNLPEAEVLCGFAIGDERSTLRAAQVLAAMTPGAVLIKGGHGKENANDFLLTATGEQVWIRGERIDTENTHGTGCTLSSAIACGLAQGMLMADAVRSAKAYVTGALAAGLDLGKGSGPLNHFWMTP